MQIKISGKPLGDAPYLMEVLDFETIEEIKERISAKIFLEPRFLALFFLSKFTFGDFPVLELMDNRTVGEYRIHAGEHLFLEIREESSSEDGSHLFEVRFETENDESLMIPGFEKESKVIILKMRIQDAIGLPVHLQRLCYEGNTLEDEKTLEEYGIGENSLIRVSIGLDRLPKIRQFT